MRFLKLIYIIFTSCLLLYCTTDPGYQSTNSLVVYKQFWVLRNTGTSIKVNLCSPQIKNSESWNVKEADPDDLLFKIVYSTENNLNTLEDVDITQNTDTKKIVLNYEPISPDTTYHTEYNYIIDNLEHGKKYYINTIVKSKSLNAQILCDPISITTNYSFTLTTKPAIDFWNEEHGFASLYFLDGFLYVDNYYKIEVNSEFNSTLITTGNFSIEGLTPLGSPTTLIYNASTYTRIYDYEFPIYKLDVNDTLCNLIIIKNNKETLYENIPLDYAHNVYRPYFFKNYLFFITDKLYRINLESKELNCIENFKNWGGTKGPVFYKIFEDKFIAVSYGADWGQHVLAFYDVELLELLAWSHSWHAYDIAADEQNKILFNSHGWDMDCIDVYQYEYK